MKPINVTELMKNFSVKGFAEKPLKKWTIRTKETVKVHTYKAHSRYNSCICERTEEFHKMSAIPIYILRLKERTRYGSKWLEVTYIRTEKVPEEYEGDINAMVYSLPSVTTDLKNISLFDTKELAEKACKEENLKTVEEKIEYWEKQISEAETELKNAQKVLKAYVNYFDKYKL